MGVVYKATRPDLGDRTAALKVIRPGLLDDEAVQARFAREVEVLRRVRDVHISEFIDADLRGDPAWLATAFIEGPNLRDHVAARGPLSADGWWELARGLAQALAVLEVHGITHRDMKPANVILAEHGPVLIDFGIAVPEDAASLTGTGLVTGSPAWLSPEQANLKPVSVASDIFSLGSLLAFAGTGRPPFGAGAHVAMLLAIATRDPDTAGLSEDQHRLLTAMMAKEPGARPSARQVLQWAKGGGAGVPVSAPLDSSATQVLSPGAAPHTQTIPGLEATTIAPAAASATGPVTAPVAAAPPPTEPPPTAAPRRRRGWLPILAVVLAAALVGIWWTGRDGGDRELGERDDQVEETPEPSTPPTPPAPTPGTVAQSGDWVLAGWSIENDAAGSMSVAGTIRNTGSAAATGYATVFIYSDGAAIGSAEGQLPEVPAGGQAAVTLVGDDPWAPGAKSVALDVQ